MNSQLAEKIWERNGIYHCLIETKRAKGTVLICLQVYAWFGFIGEPHIYQNQEKMEGLVGWGC